MLKIFKYLKAGEWLAAGVSIVFIVGQVWLELRLPGYMSEITTLVQTPGSAMGEIWVAAACIKCALPAQVRKKRRLPRDRVFQERRAHIL
jgi:ATP-binding cassette subfamily B protein